MADHADFDPGAWRSTAASREGKGGDFVGTALIDHLRAVAEREPLAPALIGSSETLGRAELLDRALRVAFAIERAVPVGGTVATVVAQSPAGLAGILGCILSGRVIVPLAATQPAERLSGVLATAGAALVLHDGAAAASLPAGTPTMALGDCVEAPPAGWQPVAAPADAPAMVYFTSGSSGQPKGIAVSTHGVMSRSAAVVRDWQLTEQDRPLVASGPETGSGCSFMLAAAATGAPLLVASLAGEGAGALLRLARREAASILVAGPAICRMLLGLPGAAEAVAGVRQLRVGSMALAHADAAAWRGVLPAGCTISHTYASTEAMVVAQWVVPADWPDAETVLPAGFFCPDQEYAVVDDDGRAAAPGEAGELVLRGRHIALGEWRDGRLVAGRMPADSARPGTRVFRTGDRVRVAPDGLLRVLGRIDRQVKVNGLRVEPAEIEAVLRGIPHILDVAVVPGAGVALHAFVAAPGAEPVRLRQDIASRLRASLPPALRPGRITLVDALPMLPGGKVDLPALRRRAGYA